MKRSMIVYGLVLVVGFAAVGAMYQFFIKTRYAEYTDLLAEEEDIRKKIDSLSETFDGTKPDLVIKKWREATQPWSSALGSRLSFFETIREDFGVSVPENQIPKFFYIKEFEKRKQALEDEAWESKCEIPSDETFGVPEVLGPGTNPTRKEVEEWLFDYEYGASWIRQIIESDARSLKSLDIWPPQVVLSGPEGTIEIERAGVEFTIELKSLVEFLDTMRKSDRFYSIDKIMITNSSLRDPDNPVSVSMVLARSKFTPVEVAESGEGGTVVRIRAQSGRGGGNAKDKLTSLFGEVDPKFLVPKEEPSFWLKLRKKVLLF